MAGLQQTAAEADARVAAAKARLRALADDTRPGYHLALHASNMMRERPWQGIGLALLAGVALGLAPRQALQRVTLLAAPLVGMLADLAPFDRYGVRAADSPWTATSARRSR